MGRDRDDDGRVAGALLEALLGEDAGARNAAMEAAWPLLQETITGFLRGNRSLLERSGLTEDDVVQEVTRRLLRRPPSNRNDREPVVVLRAWLKLVARRLCLDGLRRPEELEKEDEGGRSNLDRSVDPRPGRDRDLRGIVAQLDACGRQLEKERDRLAFEALRGDFDIPALDLAVAVGMKVTLADGRALPVRALLDGALPEAERSAHLHRVSERAWALKCRLLTRLKKCLTRHGFDGSLLQEEVY